MKTIATITQQTLSAVKPQSQPQIAAKIIEPVLQKANSEITSQANIKSKRSRHIRCGGVFMHIIIGAGLIVTIGHIHHRCPTHGS